MNVQQSQDETSVEIEQIQTVNGEPSKIDANVFLFIGLPGTGKTYAAEVAAETLDGTSHEFSDYVRYAYEAETGGETDDNSLGEWAAQKKAEEGADHFARGLCTSLSQGGIPRSKNMCVAGVRSPEEAEAFRERFTNVTAVSIWTLPDIRYDRLEEREGDYSYTTFHERKQRELWEWNCIKFFTDDDYYDYIIPNNFEKDLFENKVNSVCNFVADGFEYEPYTEDPFPDGLSSQHIAQYL